MKYNKVKDKNIISETIDDLRAKNKEVKITIKNDKTTKLFYYNKDGIISEINQAKFYEDGRFMEKSFVDYFITKHNVVYSRGTGFLIFNGVIWESCSDIHIQRLIADILENEDELTNAKVASSLKMLINQVNNDNLSEILNSNRNRLILKNGTLDISNIIKPVFYEYQYFKEDYCTIQLNVNYKPNYSVLSKTWDYYLHSTFENDEERINLIGEMLGYALTPSCKFHKAFMLIGEGSNGKSVLLDIIDYIWGNQNISELEMNELDRAFARSSLFGKLINKSTEIEGNIKTTSYFKKIVAGEKLNAEYKGKDSFIFPNTAKLIFAMNSLPYTKDKSDGFYRRLCIIPFNRQFKGEEIDYDLSEKLKLEADDIFMFALQGLQRLYKQNGFTKSAEVINTIQEYKVDSNPVVQFIQENYIVTFEENQYVMSQSLYEHYNMWCKNNGYKSLNNVNFGKELKRLNYNKKQKKIDSKPQWVYTNLFCR